MSRFAADLPVDVVRLRHRAAGMRPYGFGYLLHRYARNRLALVGLWVAVGIVLRRRFSRPARAQVLREREQNYVEAARAMGVGDGRIIWRHILPNSVSPIVVQASLEMAGAITAEATLSFLGLGTQPPTPSWGSMLNIAQAYLGTAPWMAVWPGLAIFITVLALNLLGDGLREALDPRLR